MFFLYIYFHYVRTQSQQSQFNAHAAINADCEWEWDCYGINWTGQDRDMMGTGIRWDFGQMMSEREREEAEGSVCKGKDQMVDRKCKRGRGKRSLYALNGWVKVQSLSLSLSLSFFLTLWFSQHFGILPLSLTTWYVYTMPPCHMPHSSAVVRLCRSQRLSCVSSATLKFMSVATRDLRLSTRIELFMWPFTTLLSLSPLSYLLFLYSSHTPAKLLQ